MARAVIGGIIFGIMGFSLICLASGETIYVVGTLIEIAIFAAILVIVEWLTKKINW